MNITNILVNQHFAVVNCSKSSTSLILPTWYEYLKCTSGSPQLTSLSDVWLIVAAIIEILLRVAALVAIGIIIYAGIQYSTSSGNPETTSKAMNTIISAAVGLLICVGSAVLVAFLAGSF